MWLQAYEWHCGDEICDCSQYVIEELTPHPVTQGFVIRAKVWKGQFISNSIEEERGETAVRLNEFRKAARQLSVRLVKDKYGHWSGERAD